jgi:sporulation protein YlmC with PRC-barrel domain
MGISEETKVTINTTFVPATEIKGSRVLTVKGEDLGNIKEVMIDSEYGRIAYVVFSYDCTLGMKCKLFAIPWEVLKPNVGDYILKIDKGAFETAEDLDKNAWTLDHKDLAKLYEQYKVHPYWKD